MTKLAVNLRRGGVTFLMTRWSAGRALELLARERMDSVGGVPSQLALMLRRPEFDDYDFESVQFIVSGGGPITPGLAEEAGRGSTPSSRRVTRAPRPRSVSVPGSTIPTRTRS